MNAEGIWIMYLGIKIINDIADKAIISANNIE